MRSDPRPLHFRFLGIVVLGCLSFLAGQVSSEQIVVAGQTITTPPCGQATKLAQLQRRDSETSCSFGSCAGTCLSQGAFCCNPGGTSFTPNWICDNGACITSVRGDTGVVDCYDPDNPSGTTQSCIDFKPTTTCYSTDRCYTCSSDQPFCFWQTWIATHSPTLRWFSCIETKQPDATYVAATITNPPSSTSTSKPSSASTSATSASPTSTTSSTSTSSSSTSSSSTPSTSSSTAPPTPTSSTATATATASPSSPALTTGAIIGIAIGGAGLLLLLLGLILYCLRSRHQTQQHEQQQRTRPSISHPSPAAELATPVHYTNSLAGSGSHSHGATTVGGDGEYWRYRAGSAPSLVPSGGVEERWLQKTRMPVELPVQGLRGEGRRGEGGGYEDGGEIGVARAGGEGR